jgi:hypothetical protein
MKKIPRATKSYEADEVQRYLGSLAEEFKGYVKAVAEQYGGVNRKLDGIVEDIAIVKTDVSLMKSSLVAKVDYRDFAALEKRVRLIETKIRR